MKEFRSILARLRAPGPPPALATLCRVRGSSYRRPGARLLLTADGVGTGSISGGCLEEDVILRAQEVARTGAAQAVTYDTTEENDLVWGVGLGCHGVVDLVIEPLADAGGWADWAREAFARRADLALAVMFTGPAPGTKAGLASDGRSWSSGGGPELLAGLRATLERGESHHQAIGGDEVFFEFIPHPTPMVILGAGNDAQPLCRMAAELGYDLSVVDPRPAYATRERFPAADRVLVAAPEELSQRVPLDNRTVAVVMTHHYRHDLPLLRQLLPQPLAYLGLLGPLQRAERIVADLAAEGIAITPAMRDRLHAPVGLDLGGKTPESVAVAILAEIESTLAGRAARPLRERKGPIHG